MKACIDHKRICWMPFSELLVPIVEGADGLGTEKDLEDLRRSWSLDVFLEDNAILYLHVKKIQLQKRERIDPEVVDENVLGSVAQKQTMARIAEFRVRNQTPSLSCGVCYQNVSGRSTEIDQASSC